MAPPDSEAYHFAIYVRLPEHQRLMCLEASAALPGLIADDRLELRPGVLGDIGDARSFVLFGFGYSTPDEARSMGQRARSGLSLAATECGLGIDWEDKAEKGVNVWRGIRAWGRVGGRSSASPTFGSNIAILSERLKGWLTLSGDLTDREQACAELLRDYHFDVSQRSRFLLAYAAIEELCEGSMPQSDQRRAALVALEGHLSSLKLEPDDLDWLRSTLRHHGGLQSTGRCREIIRQRLGVEAVTRFNSLSRHRGEIAHKGKGDAAHSAAEVYDLARQLLFASIRTRTMTVAAS